MIDNYFLRHLTLSLLLLELKIINTRNDIDYLTSTSWNGFVVFCVLNKIINNANVYLSKKNCQCLSYVEVSLPYEKVEYSSA